MKTCKSCKLRDSKSGYCQSDKLAEANCQNADTDKSDMLIYSYTESGGFWVGENFGCVHHTTREK